MLMLLQSELNTICTHRKCQAKTIGLCKVNQNCIFRTVFNISCFEDVRLMVLNIICFQKHFIGKCYHKETNCEVCMTVGSKHEHQKEEVTLTFLPWCCFCGSNVIKQERKKFKGGQAVKDTTYFVFLSDPDPEIWSMHTKTSGLLSSVLLHLHQNFYFFTSNHHLVSYTPNQQKSHWSMSGEYIQYFN